MRGRTTRAAWKWWARKHTLTDTLTDRNWFKVVKDSIFASLAKWPALDIKSKNWVNIIIGRPLKICSNFF